jgi:hypothetical protein
VTYDTKYYEFATTVHSPAGKIVPPEGERWVFIQMVTMDKSLALLWARQKKP